MKSARNPNQYVLPLDADRHELLAQVRLLRSIDLGLSPGRAEGVVELLERLALLGNDLREIGGVVNVRAQTIAIAARIDSRRTVADRTVRNWRSDAEALGLVQTEFRSHQYGRREWNRYAINVSRLRAIVREGGSGRKWAEMVAAPRAEMVAAPRAEMVAAPLNCEISEKQLPTEQTPAAGQTPVVVVVSQFPKVEEKADDWTGDDEQRFVAAVAACGVGRAEESIARARANGSTPGDVRDRLDAWHALPPPSRRPGTLFNWLACRGSYAAWLASTRAAAGPSPEQLAAAAAARRARELERRRFEIVRQGRRLGVSESEIERRLVAAGVT
jgi:hypothetical protein